MSNKGKDTKKSDTPSRDVTFRSTEFAFNNRLALPDEVKEYLTGKGLDWRFLNAQEFRASGNIHRSHWRPFKIPAEMAGADGFYGANAEGLIQRGDLILGVREKAITVAHKEHINKRNKALYQQATVEGQAKKLKETVRESSIAADTKILEGYEDEK